MSLGRTLTHLLLDVVRQTRVEDPTRRGVDEAGSAEACQYLASSPSAGQPGGEKTCIFLQLRRKDQARDMVSRGVLAQQGEARASLTSLPAALAPS